MLTLSKKEHIPLAIKQVVWEKCSIYPLNPEITKCQTCNNLVLMPESLKSLNGIPYDIKPIYINGKRQQISGVGEFGHIVSESNGGKAHANNLIIQCKTCNTRQNTKNISKDQIITECDMLDVYCEPNIEMGDNYETCQRICDSGQKCKNKAIINRRFCHIHLVS